MTDQDAKFREIAERHKIRNLTCTCDLDYKYEPLNQMFVAWQARAAASERGQECKCGPAVAGNPLITKTFCSVCNGEVHE